MPTPTKLWLAQPLCDFTVCILPCSIPVPSSSYYHRSQIIRSRLSQCSGYKQARPGADTQAHTHYVIYMTVIDTGFCFVVYQATLSYNMFVVSARCGIERTLSLSQGGALVTRDYANPISVQPHRRNTRLAIQRSLSSLSLSLPSLFTLSLHLCLITLAS